MVFTPQRAPVLKGASAPTGTGTVLPADSIDYAAAGLTSLVDYMRGKNVSDPTRAFKTRTGNIATPGDANGALVAGDPNFSGLRSINLANMAGSSRLVSSALCPVSFTAILDFRVTSLPSLTTLFGVSTSGFYVNASATGTLSVLAAQSGDTQWSDNNVLLPVNITSLIWISHDAPTKTTRVGKGAAVLASHVHGVPNAPVATSTFRPYSFYAGNAGSGPKGNSQGYALLAKAYAADGSAEDVAIAALIATWRSGISAAN